MNSWSRDYNYSEPASNETHSIRISRAVVLYFPVEKTKDFEYEFKWLYRSWLHMMQFEPSKWRTDLVVFINNNSQLFNQSDFFLNELNCSFSNIRKSSEDLSMCTLRAYAPLKSRTFKDSYRFSNKAEKYW